MRALVIREKKRDDRGQKDVGREHLEGQVSPHVQALTYAQTLLILWNRRCTYFFLVSNVILDPIHHASWDPFVETPPQLR